MITAFDLPRLAIAIVVFGQVSQSLRVNYESKVYASARAEGVTVSDADAETDVQARYSRLYQLLRSDPDSNIDDQRRTMLRMQHDWANGLKVIGGKTEVLKRERKQLCPRFIRQISCYSLSGIEKPHFDSGRVNVLEGLCRVVMRFSTYLGSLAFYQGRSLPFNRQQCAKSEPGTDSADKYEQTSEDDGGFVPPVLSYRHGRQFADTYGFLCICVGWIVAALFLFWGTGLVLDGKRTSGWSLIAIGFFIDSVATASGAIGCLPLDWWNCLHDNQQHSNRQEIHGADHFISQPRPGRGLVAALTKAENNQIQSRSLQQFAYAPDVIRDSGGHCWRYTQRLVDTNEIVKTEPQSNCSPVVLPFLAESIRQASESPSSHAYAQILPFNNRGANSFRVGATHNWDHLRTGYFWGRVSVFIASCRTINLDELREIDAIPECRFNGRFVRLESIRGDLEFSPRGMAQTFNKNVRGGLVFRSRNR
jgi:hypothetical protein